MSKTMIKIGRNPACDICVESSLRTVSNNHSTIEFKNGLYFYTDHSTNGTVVNGRVIHNETVEVRYGDNINLSGVYELDWSVVKSFFPTTSRETTPISSRGTTSRGTMVVIPKNYSSNKSDEVRVSGSQSAVCQSNYNNVKQQIEPASQFLVNDVVERWNWGAFLCSWLWAAFHRKYWPMLVLFLLPFPYVGQVAQITLSCYLGFNGSRIAWECGKYSTVGALESAQKRWGIFGVLCFFVNIAINAISVYVVLTCFQ